MASAPCAAALHERVELLRSRRGMRIDEHERRRPASTAKLATSLPQAWRRAPLRVRSGPAPDLGGELLEHAATTIRAALHRPGRTRGDEGARGDRPGRTRPRLGVRELVSRCRRADGSRPWTRACPASPGTWTRTCAPRAATSRTWRPSCSPTRTRTTPGWCRPAARGRRAGARARRGRRDAGQAAAEDRRRQPRATSCPTSGAAHDMAPARPHARVAAARARRGRERRRDLLRRRRAGRARIARAWCTRPATRRATASSCSRAPGRLFVGDALCTLNPLTGERGTQLMPFPPERGQRGLPRVADADRGRSRRRRDPAGIHGDPGRGRGPRPRRRGRARPRVVR